jgi:choline-glycine betaine transporter
LAPWLSPICAIDLARIARGLKMSKELCSNGLLGLGMIMLVLFVVLELTGLRADPLLPALAALALGGTAVLDRIGDQEEFE